MDKIENHKLKSQNSVVAMKALIVLLVVVGTCWAGGCPPTGEVSPRADTQNLVGCEAKEAQKADANSVEVVLEKLKKQIGELKSYQSQIEYKFSQPLLESETLRKGVLYYQKAGGKSALRINFQTLKQDDEEEQEHIEQYIFDGVWLTHIDYQIKEVKRYQQAEPNEPVDAFELVRENFLIIGFSKADELEEEFEIELVGQKGVEEGYIQLHLKVKSDSIYKDDYTSIDFWIDKKLYLPAKIVAISTSAFGPSRLGVETRSDETSLVPGGRGGEEDIHEVRLLNARVNEKIVKKVFEVKIPEGFGVEITPLKKETKDPRLKTNN